MPDASFFVSTKCRSLLDIHGDILSKKEPIQALYHGRVYIKEVC